MAHKMVPVVPLRTHSLHLLSFFNFGFPSGNEVFHLWGRTCGPSYGFFLSPGACVRAVGTRAMVFIDEETETMEWMLGMDHIPRNWKEVEGKSGSQVAAAPPTVAPSLITLFIVLPK